MDPSESDTYVVTGPTSGIGFRAAMDLAPHGTLILVGRDRSKLDGVRQQIERAGGKVFTVVCDVSDPVSVQHAAREIIAIGLLITGVLNNAGVMLMKPGKNALGHKLIKGIPFSGET
jgi:short-subunit dehydrogenase